MIDVIIPTMWMAETTLDAIQKYCKHPKISKVILIDNNAKMRPKAFSKIAGNSKIDYVSYGKNIYVNPAWNEGYHRSTADIIAIINDDVIVDDSVFDMVLEYNPQPGNLIGVNLRGFQNNYKIDDVIQTEEEIVKLNYNKNSPIGGQAWAFGICLFMHRKTYKVIPSIYQIWYGDDYLAQNAKSVYAINSNKIKGTISETLKKFNNPNDEISKRIELDSKNFLRFNHFQNGQNWDIPKNTISQYEQQRKSISKTIDAKPATDKFEAEYQLARKTISDINENVHILYKLSKECETAIEFGVRTGVSTRAFLNTDVSLTSFDIVKNNEVAKLFATAKAQGKKAEYIIRDVLKIEIPEVDLLFIDTLHTYDQLKQELAMHGNKAKRYLVFHDTHTFGLSGEVGNDKKGLLPAIIEFMANNRHWVFHTHKTNNNGLTVLERTK
jgi:hypothetical protein